MSKKYGKPINFVKDLILLHSDLNKKVDNTTVVEIPINNAIRGWIMQKIEEEMEKIK